MDSDLIIDEIIRDVILDRLTDFSLQALKAMQNDVFDEDRTPKCYRRIDNEIRELNAR